MKFSKIFSFFFLPVFFLTADAWGVEFLVREPVETLTAQHMADLRDLRDADAVIAWLEKAFPVAVSEKLPGLTVAVGNLPWMDWADAESAEENWKTLWTPAHKDHFSRKFGYSLEPFLPILFADTDAEDAPPEAVEKIVGLRRDVNRVLKEVYREKFLTPIRQWCFPRGVRMRFCFAENADTQNLLAQMDAARVCDEMYAPTPETLRYAEAVAELEGRMEVFFAGKWQPGLERHEVERNDRIEAESDSPLLSGLSEMENGQAILIRSFRSTTLRSSPGCHTAAVLAHDASLFEKLDHAGISYTPITEDILAEGTATRVSPTETILGLGPMEFRTLILSDEIDTLAPEAAEFVRRFLRLGGEVRKMDETEP